MRAADAAARVARRPCVRAGSCAIAAAALLIARTAWGQEATEWLSRAAQAARSLNYSGTLVYQHGGRVETTRVLHLADSTGEHEKLINLDGPPREVVRNNERIRCYYPDAKIIRI
jgi:sigma-E factor negative regulatory protein RseB